MATVAGFEPATSCVTGRRASHLRYTAILVTPAGFEPGIAAVKGRCPIRLDERAMFSSARELNLLCDHTDLKRVRADNDIADRDAEDCGQDDQVVQGGQGLAPLPLVDGLGIAEAEDSLQILHGESGLLPQTDDISSGRGHINDRPHVHLIYAPFRPWAGLEPTQLALKL